jgi:hypothetical protein
VKFRITRHSGFKAPADALELLWQRLDGRRDGASFAMVGAEIRATVGDDVPISMTRDERIEVGRLALLEILGDVCEQAPELRFDWFAVSALPY